MNFTQEMSTNPIFIFIDGSYFCFYRYHSLLTWWKNAYPEQSDVLLDPYNNEKFVEKFKKDVPYYLRRLVIRPGLTGWNQVHYRDYEETLEEITNRLKHDFYYIENMSLQLDVEIIIRTVIRVFRGQGQA